MGASKGATDGSTENETDLFDADLDPDWSYNCSGTGSMHGAVFEALIDDAHARVETLPVTSNDVTILLEALSGDDSISVTANLTPDQAEAFAENVIDCAAAARQQRDGDRHDD